MLPLLYIVYWVHIRYMSVRACVCVCVCVRFVLGKIRLVLSAVLALARDLIQLLCFMPFWYQTFFITSASSLTHSLFLSLSLVCTMHFVEFLLFSYKPNKFALTEYCLYVAVVLDELMLQRIYVYAWMLREATEKSSFFSRVRLAYNVCICNIDWTCGKLIQTPEWQCICK